MRARRTTALAVAGTVSAALALATAAPVGAAPKRADLVVTRVGTPPATVDHGTTFGLGVVVANRGSAASRATTVRYYLSKNRTRGTDDIASTVVAVKRVRPGKKKTVSARVKVPWGTKAGTYWVIACADPNKKVRESKEGNNCRISKRPVKVLADIHADLTGQLKFVDEGQRVVDGETQKWRRTATVTVEMKVDGDPKGKTTFASAGSAYQRAGTRTYQKPEDFCVRDRSYSETGGGVLRYVGNGFDDDIVGHFARTDMSRVRIGLFMQADWRETRTQTGRGDNPCENSTTKSQGKTLDVSSIQLKQVGLTPTTISYEVADFEGDNGSASEWDRIVGKVVLQLR